MAKNLSAKKLYIDDEGVERGFYVYLHKDSTTGEVFYVGMGSGRRAWDKKPRGAGWQEKTNSLGNAWTVEIVKDDLSELAAFELEREKIMEYGGPAGAGGPLTNRWYGGEQPLAVSVSVELPDFGWGEAYYAARRFRNVPRVEQEQLVRDFLAQIEPTETALADLDEESMESQDDSLGDSASNIDNALSNLIEDGKNFLKRKLS